MLLRNKEAEQKPKPDELGTVSRASRRLLQLWDQLLVLNGVLCRRFEPLGGKPVNQIVIPAALREEVLTDLHKEMMESHLGVDKMLERLKEQFYWPGH